MITEFMVISCEMLQSVGSSIKLIRALSIWTDWEGRRAGGRGREEEEKEGSQRQRVGGWVGGWVSGWLGFDAPSHSSSATILVISQNGSLGQKKKT